MDFSQRPFRVKISHCQCSSAFRMQLYYLDRSSGSATSNLYINTSAGISIEVYPNNFVTGHSTSVLELARHCVVNNLPYCTYHKFDAKLHDIVPVTLFFRIEAIESNGTKFQIFMSALPGELHHCSLFIIILRFVRRKL